MLARQRLRRRGGTALGVRGATAEVSEMPGQLRVRRVASRNVRIAAVLRRHDVTVEGHVDVGVLSILRGLRCDVVDAARVAHPEVVQLAPDLHERLPRRHSLGAPRHLLERLRGYGTVRDLRVPRVADGHAVAQGPPPDCGRPLRLGGHEEHQLAVHHHVQFRRVNVVRIAAKWILDFPRYVVEAPENEDLREGQGERPPRFVHPLTQHEGGDDGVQN
mmetsp:Transcript_73017/g.143168  ORF Transcript_73017/g.143168 Transcript_73017/m.143168 type:complete len:218 (-) Transcript_73017:639-1292(-)